MAAPFPYTIRPARRDELALLGTVQLAAAKRFSPDILPEPMRSTYTVEAEVLEHALARHGLWVAADAEDRPVGYAVLREAGGLAFLHQVDVLPEHGEQGLGKALVVRVAERARELGYGALYLTTFRDVAWNAPFYAKLGFAVPGPGQLPEPVLVMLAAETAVAPGRVAMRLDLSQETHSSGHGTPA